MPSNRQDIQPSATARLRRLRGAAGVAVLTLTLGVMAATGAIPWNAAASSPPAVISAVPPVAAAPASVAALPAAPVAPPDPPALATDAGLADSAAAPDERRVPRQIAVSLERKLKALREAKERGNLNAANALRQDLLSDRRLASDELQSQIDRDSSPVYWALAILREALETDDDVGMERAQRYMRGALAQGN